MTEALRRVTMAAFTKAAARLGVSKETCHEMYCAALDLCPPNAKANAHKKYGNGIMIDFDAGNFATVTLFASGKFAVEYYTAERCKAPMLCDFATMRIEGTA